MTLPPNASVAEIEQRLRELQAHRPMIVGSEELAEFIRLREEYYRRVGPNDRLYIPDEDAELIDEDS